MWAADRLRKIALEKFMKLIVRDIVKNFDKKVLNIQSIDYIEKDILNAINNIEKYKKVNKFFGEGNSSDLIVRELSKTSFWNKDIQKVFYDLNLKNIR